MELMQWDACCYWSPSHCASSPKSLLNWSEKNNRSKTSLMLTSKDNFLVLLSATDLKDKQWDGRKLPISVNWHHWHSCEQELPREQYQQYPDLKRCKETLRMRAAMTPNELTYSPHLMQHGYDMIYCSIDSSLISDRRLRNLANHTLFSHRYCKHLQKLHRIYSNFIHFLIYFNGHCKARDGMSSRWCDYWNMFTCGVSPVTPENWTEHMMPSWC